jgi:hypothetical protein
VHPLKLLKTTTFRLALLYLVLFLASVVALLGFVYWNTFGYIDRQVNETIQAEVTGLAEQYRSRGLAGLIRVVRERSTQETGSEYLLTRPDYAKIAGTLPGWPNAPTEPGGWVEFTLTHEAAHGDEVRAVRARHYRLPGGFHLLVGRDVEQRREIGATVRTSLIWTLALTVLLGLVGAYVFSQNALRRVDAINKTSRDIMSGELSRRLPVEGSGDEIDQLSTNLNAMLDQIERLMIGMKTVSDNVAHDLRSPLNRLRNRLEVTLMQPATEEEYKGALERSIEDADQLLKTFNALLSIARVESGSLREEMETVDAADVVRDMADLYDPLAEEKSIRLTTDIADAAMVRGNRELISQAVANVVDNAIKYTPEGGEVTVSVHAPAGGGAAIVVRDTGPGIPETERERVLQRFVRLELSRNSPGSGLGLSLVAAVAQLHRGRFVLSDAPGGGLEATIFLPAAV